MTHFVNTFILWLFAKGTVHTNLAVINPYSHYLLLAQILYRKHTCLWHISSPNSPWITRTPSSIIVVVTTNINITAAAAAAATTTNTRV
jgi:hypothetical protein